jgi:hypothetical protein
VETLTPRFSTTPRSTPRATPRSHEVPHGDETRRRLPFTAAAAGGEEAGGDRAGVLGGATDGVRYAGLPKWPTRRANPGRRPPSGKLWNTLSTPSAQSTSAAQAQRTPSTYRGDVTSSLPADPPLASPSALLLPWSWPSLW